MTNLANQTEDAPARIQIEKELDINIVLEAGAGSGKTSSLVKRMVHSLGEGKFKITEIAAITFTRKAAGELRERFQMGLEEAFQKENQSLIKKSLESAQDQIDSCFIGTVHSFCARILRERPVEAGIVPDFRELDERENKHLASLVWQDYLNKVRLERPEALEVLLKWGIEPNDLMETYLKLIDFPDVEIVGIKRPHPDPEPVLAKIRSFANRALEGMPDDEPDNGWDDLQKAVLTAKRYFKNADVNQMVWKLAVIKKFSTDIKVTQKRWRTKEDALQFMGEGEALAREDAIPFLDKWYEACHEPLLQFVKPAITCFAQYRLDQGVLNYQDLLQRTADLLREYPEVRHYFQTKYRSLLVDEFQDTDPLQAEVLFYLTGRDTYEKDWRKLVPTPGSLFVVGDPKQSIYRFRRADIDTYNLVKERITQSGGKVLKLTANFRSVNELGEWFNVQFQELMHPSHFQAEFTPMETVQVLTAKTQCGVKILSVQGQIKTKEDAFKADAESIAYYIRETLDGAEQKRNPSDFLILLREKDGMKFYSEALAKEHIPYTISGTSQLTEVEELAELYRLLRFLADPGNQILFVGVLRGIFFGFSDDELFHYKNVGGFFSPYSQIPEGLDEELMSRLKSAFSKLQEYRQWALTLRPMVTIEKIIDDTGLILGMAGSGQNVSQCAAILQTLEILRGHRIKNHSSFSELVKAMGSLLRVGVEEELDLEAKSAGSVRIMNLHKAKGLEAPIVILAQPWKTVKKRVDFHIERTEGKGKGYFPFSKRNSFGHEELLAKPLGWQAACAAELQYLEAEEIRLLYVAATRAKNLLVISKCVCDPEMKHNPWRPLIERDKNIEELVIRVDANSQEVAWSKALESVVSNQTSQTLRNLGSDPGQDGLDSFVTFQAGLMERLESLALPTYAEQSPTGLKTQEQVKVFRVHGGGTSWGNVIHTVFEKVYGAKGSVPERSTIIRYALAKNGEASERLEEVENVLNRFEKTELYQRLQKAERKLIEVPFLKRLEPGEPWHSRSDLTGDIPVHFSGVRDLVFQEADGWVIVDYKTDRVARRQDWEVLYRHYRGQIELYKFFWQEISGERVKETVIYFAETVESRSEKSL